MIIYLVDMLVLSHTIREARMSRDAVVYLLDFIINIKKSILHPCQKIEFLGMEIDSIKMTLSLTPEKVQKVVKTCQNLLRSHSTTLLELTRVVGLLSSTIQAVEPAKIQLRFLQQQQIVCLRKKNELSVSNNIKHQVKDRVNLVDRELEVLQWPNVFSVEPASNYSNRCFPDRVESSLKWGSNIRAMVRGREILTHKCAGTTSNKTGSLFLHQREKGESHTLSDRQQGSLFLPLENGGNKERIYDQIEQRDLALSSQSQYGYHSKYLPSVLKTVADRESRKKNQTLQSGFFIPKFFKRFLNH